MFSLTIRRAPRSTRTDTRFPYTTLLRSDDFAVLARTGFGFVGVDDEEARAVGARLLRHERPFEPRGEARAAAAAQARRLDLLDDRVLAALHQILGLIPIAARLRGFEVPRLERSAEHTSELQSLMRIPSAVF